MSEFWSDKDIVITGHRGFLGSHIINILNNRGVKPRTTGTLYLDTQVSALECFSWDTCHTLIHCAAFVGGIGLNQKEPGRMIYDNLQMGLNIMEAARLNSIPKTIIIGTTCAYPENTPEPFKERDLWNGYPEPTNAPYGIAKRTIAELQRAYHEQYGVVSNHLILANLYGPGDNFNPQSSHVIPAIIRKMHEAKLANSPEVVLWGSGEPTRDFLYVEDAAQAILLAAEHYDSVEPLNIGTGISYPIWQIADLIKKIVGYKGATVWDKTKPDGQRKRRLDTTGLIRELDWHPTTPLHDGLEKTVQYYMQNVAEAH